MIVADRASGKRERVARGMRGCYGGYSTGPLDSVGHTTIVHPQSDLDSMY